MMYQCGVFESSLVSSPFLFHYLESSPFSALSFLSLSGGLPFLYQEKFSQDKDFSDLFGSWLKHLLILVTS